MLNRFLDYIVTPLGVGLAVALLMAVTASTVHLFRSSIQQIEAQREQFVNSGLREGLVAMSDVQRVSLLLQGAVAEGGASAERRDELGAALDALRARAEAMLEDSRRTKDAARRVLPVVDDLFVLVDLGDAAAAAQFQNVDAFTTQFLGAAEQSHQTIAHYLEATRRDQDALFLAKAAAAKRQVLALTITLSILTVGGGLTLGLLRREVISRNARNVAERRVQFLAFHDPLTRLPNRVQFQERAGIALLAQPAAAMVFVDLDDFKGINDTFGHAAGDAVLRHTGQLLHRVAEDEGGFAARIAGDEFAVFLPTDDVERIHTICERLLAGYATPIENDVERIPASISIGAATTTQVATWRSLQFDDIARVTDFALYSAKSQGRGRFAFYDTALEGEFQKRRALLDELPAAIEKGALDVFLQPKFDLAQHAVFGFEALVRWRRGGKIVAPGEFIKVAEESNLIGRIDQFVLLEAARVVADWNRRQGTRYSVSVNLSALHFSSNRIVGTVRGVLEKTGLAPDLLILEVTETVEISDWLNVQVVLEGLRDLGCRISIDDFGAGYSSFAYLRQMAADELKIDRSLLQQIEFSEEARFVLDAVLDLAASLKLDVIVEGVEKVLQVAVLAEMGVERIQGFLTGRPVPALEALSCAGRGVPELASFAGSARGRAGKPGPGGLWDSDDKALRNRA